MRTIRFRAFHPQSHRMMEIVRKLTWYHDKAEDYDKPYIRGIGIGIGDVLAEGFEIMQSIGTFDKNKKEIFEGDIVLWRKQVGYDETKEVFTPIYSEEYILGIVKYLSGIYGCEFYPCQISNGKFRFHNEPFSDSDDNYPLRFYDYGGADFSWGELEVVGNVCEMQFPNSEIEEKVKAYFDSEAGKKGTEIPYKD